MNMVLPDTCVWIESMRSAQSAQAEELVPLVDAMRIVTTGIVISEVLQGVRDEHAFDETASYFSELPYIELTRKMYIAAGKLSVTLRSRGVVIPLSDLLIASACIEHGIQIYTSDKHFEHIPGLKHWKPRKN
jgi:predicted nucleic acid-binding protein